MSDGGADPVNQVRTDRDDLLDHLVATTGMDRRAVDWLVTEIGSFYRETAADFVVRRHGELRRRGLRNDEIYRLIGTELETRPVRAPTFSDRQLRRLVTG